MVSNDQDTNLIDRQQLIREVAKSMDIDADGIIKTEEQLQIEQQQLQQQQLAMQQAEMQQQSGASDPQALASAGMG